MSALRRGQTIKVNKLKGDLYSIIEEKKAIQLELYENAVIEEMMEDIYHLTEMIYEMKNNTDTNGCIIEEQRGETFVYGLHQWVKLHYEVASFEKTF